MKKTQIFTNCDMDYDLPLELYTPYYEASDGPEVYDKFLPSKNPQLNIQKWFRVGHF